jgi:hypothetical protein
MLPSLSQNKKCICYIVTITEGAVATKAAVTEAAAMGTAATEGAAMAWEHPQEQQLRKPPREQQSHSSS